MRRLAASQTLAVSTPAGVTSAPAARMSTSARSVPATAGSMPAGTWSRPRPAIAGRSAASAVVAVAAARICASVRATRDRLPHIELRTPTICGSSTRHATRVAAVTAVTALSRRARRRAVPVAAARGGAAARRGRIGFTTRSLAARRRREGTESAGALRSRRSAAILRSCR